jgi:protein-S-isoprenylcysteine O-methyltransferase Ste14
MKNRLLKLTQHEYSPTQRLIALFFAGILFIVLIPAALITAGPQLDQRWSLPPFQYGPINVILGVLCILIFWPLGLWANWVQFTLGRGTPVPLMATQKLLIVRPYSYCRNPMALGAIGAYLGIAVWLGSLSAVGLVLLGATCLLVYIKLIEEREMVARFGAEYLDYRRQTPFLIPRFSTRKTQGSR